MSFLSRGIVDSNRSSMQVVPVEVLDGRSGMFSLSHGDEAETTGAVSLR